MKETLYDLNADLRAARVRDRREKIFALILAAYNGQNIVADWNPNEKTTLYKIDEPFSEGLVKAAISVYDAFDRLVKITPTGETK